MCYNNLYDNFAGPYCARFQIEERIVRMESMQQVSKQLIKGLPRRIALMLLDCGLIVLCYWLAVMLRFDSGDATAAWRYCAPWPDALIRPAHLYDRVLVRRTV